MAKACPKCGLMNPSEGQRCDCGYNFVSGATSPSASGIAPSEPALRYRGVRGWLLWLCLGLTFINPMWTLINLMQSWAQSTPVFDLFPGLAVVVAIDTLLSVGLMAFSIYAGLQLWQVRRDAVPTAKTYFLCMLAYQGVASVLPFMAGLPQEVQSELLQGVIRDGVRAAIGVAIWYSYLNRSRRVKATYAYEDAVTV